jgi:hypothetical protein
VVTGDVKRDAGYAAAGTVLIAKHGSAEEGGGFLRSQGMCVFGPGNLNTTMVEIPDKYYSITLAGTEAD